MESTNNNSNIIICPDCDLLLTEQKPALGYSISCPRCGKRLRKRKKDSVRRTFVLSITGLLMYLPAVLLPLMTFESLGFSDSATVIESIVNFYHNGYHFVSLMVFLSALIFPLLLLVMIFVLSFNLHRHHYPAYLRTLFKYYIHLEDWAMLEVYLLGVLITVIKMVDSSEIVYHAGLFCFTSLVVISIAISTTIDKQYFWQLIEDKGVLKNSPPTPMAVDFTSKLTTGLQHKLIICHTCEKIVAAHSAGKSCPRCATKIHSRLPGAIGKTSALILTSILFILPANLLPIMKVDFLGVTDESTILDGIIYFFQHGSFFIGFIIFTASILVPVFKIIGLSILLFSTRPCAARFLRKKTIMYRWIAFIGRWSMLDIFVIALLVALVDFGFFTSVHVASAATYFCLVVTTTMFAAITFDPRIMWDDCTQSQSKSILKKHSP